MIDALTLRNRCPVLVGDRRERGVMAVRSLPVIAFSMLRLLRMVRIRLPTNASHNPLYIL